MSEWLKEHAWKACVQEIVPRVRIPFSPPFPSTIVSVNGGSKGPRAQWPRLCRVHSANPAPLIPSTIVSVNVGSKGPRVQWPAPRAVHSANPRCESLSLRFPSRSIPETWATLSAETVLSRLWRAPRTQRSGLPTTGANRRLVSRLSLDNDRGSPSVLEALGAAAPEVRS
jgi:hypothetical protein